MNLTKAYDLAKSLEIPQLQPYANGFNPEILPPYVALGEIQAKEARGKRLNAMQGAATGEQPSIKEQYDQKAEGLMALQAKEQQAQQQMMSQMAQAPQPVPEGVPQPEQQPQPQMMAEGGLARLPVNPRMFDYRAGGIIGFFEGNEVPGAEALDTQRVEAAARAKKIKELQDKVRFLREAEAPQAAKYEAELAALLQNSPPAGIPTTLPKAAPATPPATPPVARPPAARPVAPTGQAIPSATPPAAPPATPPAASPGLPSVAPSKYEQMQMDALNERVKPISAAQAKAERDQATPELLRQPAGLEQLARLKQQQEQYEEGKKSRPMENWMRGLASAARGGIGGFGTSYLETAEGNRASDAAQAAYQDKVMTAVDAMRRGEATEEQKSILDSVAKGRTAADEDTRNRRSNITSARSAESQREIANLDRASREKIAEIDQNMRERHYRAPIVASTEKERFIKEYMKTGLSYTAALAKVMEVLGEGKASIASGRIDASNAKILFEDPRYMQAQKTLLDPNKSASEKAKAQITIDVAEKALGIQPQSSQPTMTPAQKAALEKYGAK